jgi:hypothetical protein
MKRRHFVVIVVFDIGVIFLFVMFLKYVPYTFLRPRRTPVPPEETFRQYVLSPIPKSVTNIKADPASIIFGYTYTFRFKINRDDLGLIINSRPFIRVWNVKYENGCLSWHWDRDGPFGIGLYGSSMDCYDSKGEPRWFRPGMWDDPETYAFSKHGDLVNIETFEKDSSGPVEIRVLLYNEKENEAYFVISSWDH